MMDWQATEMMLRDNSALFAIGCYLLGIFQGLLLASIWRRGARR
jgi:hypothetical protein